MIKIDGLHDRCRALLGTLVLLMALLVGLTADGLAIVGHADSSGKVTASSANIRKEPSTSSDSVGSALQDAVVNVKGQITGSDGLIWYQVTDGTITGYIRSDLMTITDGSTPSTIVSSTTSSTSSTPTTSTPDETLVEVAAVEPVEGTVSSSTRVRVRQNASTTSRIVNTAGSGTKLTIIGQAVGTDGMDWLQVSMTSGGSEIKGFVQARFVSVSGELVPAGTSPETPGDSEQPGAEEPEPNVFKDWDTYYEEGKWHLIDNTSNKSWDIENMFATVEKNKETLESLNDSNKSLQIWRIVLVMLLIILATVLTLMIFKLKDMSDAAYFDEVEKEAMHRRTADRPIERSGSGQRERQQAGAQGGRRPAGQRPSGSGSGQRPAGQRPSGSGSGQRPAGQRPAGSGSQQRPAGQRPAGSGSQQRPAGQRPAGSGEQRPMGSGSQQRPAGQRPAGSGSQQRPAGAGGGAPRPMNDSSAEMQMQSRQDYAGGQTSEYEQEIQMQENTAAQPQRKEKWKAKNFINDDEFEFQFIDVDDDQI